MAEPNTITWEGDVAPLLAAYEKLNATEKKRQELIALGGKNLAKVWDQERRNAENAAKGPSKWTVALQENTKAVSESKGEINKLREGTGQLAGAISLISPELGLATQGLQKLEGVIGATAVGAEVLGASIGTVAAAAGPLALVVAGVGYAWHEHNIQAKAAEEQLKKDTTAADGAKKAMEGLGDVIFENMVKQKELNKEWTEEQAAAVRASRSLAGQYLPAIKAEGDALEDNKRRLNELIERRTRATAALRLTTDTEEQAQARTVGLGQAIEEQRKKVQDTQKAYDTLNQTYYDARQGQTENIKKEGEVKTAKDAGTKATKDATKADREREQAAREAEVALKAEIDALLAAETAEQAHYAAIRKGVKALEDQEAAAKRTVQTDYERIEAEKMAALEIGNSIARVALMEARTDEERRDIARSLASARIAIEQKANAEIIDSQKAAAKKASEELQTIASAGLSSAESLASSLASLTTEKIAQSEERISDLQDAIDAAEANGQTVKAANLKKRKREEEKGLRATFDAGQDLARAGVVMNTAQAIMAAYAQLGPIAGSFAAAAATAVGAIELAVVNKQEPPKFNDTPGIMEGTGNGTQRQIVSLDPRDKWLAARDMDGLMKQFLGAMGGGRRGATSLTPRNEAMLAYNAVGAYGQDIARITRPGGF